MSNCCDAASGFPTAGSMASSTLNLPLVWAEINAIQQEILNSSNLCQIGGGRRSAQVAGTSPMTFVSGISDIQVVSGGAGYKIDKPAAVFLYPSTVVGTLASANVVTNGNTIVGISMIANGSGYQPVPSTLSVTSVAGSGATFTLSIDHMGSILFISVDSPGSNYQINDALVCHRALPFNPAFIDAQLRISSLGPNGEILSVAIDNTGTGYDSAQATIKIVSSIDNNLPYYSGIGFSGRVLTGINGSITGVAVDNGGTGYGVLSPTLVVSDTGTGATAKVNIVGDAVSSVTMLTSGNNYTNTAVAQVINPPLSPVPTTSAQLKVNTMQNLYGTDSNLYYQVSAGTKTDKAISAQLDYVTSYFTKLGYVIKPTSNPQTGDTLMWNIFW